MDSSHHRGELWLEAGGGEAQAVIAVLHMAFAIAQLSSSPVALSLAVAERGQIGLLRGLMGQPKLCFVSLGALGVELLPKRIHHRISAISTHVLQTAIAASSVAN